MLVVSCIYILGSAEKMSCVPAVNMAAIGVNSGRCLTADTKNIQTY